MPTIQSIQLFSLAKMLRLENCRVLNESKCTSDFLQWIISMCREHCGDLHVTQRWYIFSSDHKVIARESVESVHCCGLCVEDGRRLAVCFLRCDKYALQSTMNRKMCSCALVRRSLSVRGDSPLHYFQYLLSALPLRLVVRRLSFIIISMRIWTRNDRKENKNNSRLRKQ